jgi:hypothetical protein
MNTKNILSYLFLFAVMVLVQVLFFRNTAIYDLAFCFVYVFFLLLLPLETDGVYVILFGFLLGITIDIFYDTLGIHAAATILMGYLRKGAINLLAPNGGYENGAKPVLREQGLQWVAFYGLILISCHHFTLFLIESSNTAMLVRTIIVSICSVVFTLLVFLLFQFFFYANNRRRRR